MMMRKPLIYSLILAFLLLAIVGCTLVNQVSEPKPEHVFRMAEAHPSDYPTTLADIEFARLVEVLSEGRIKIVVYPDQALGSETSVIEQVEFGGVDITRVSLAPISEVVDVLNVLQLPYLYEDKEHMRRVLRGDIGDEILEGVEDEGFIGFGWFEAGARSFYNTKKPINTLDDLQGMNIRVLESELMVEMANALGANGVKMPYGEVYRALQLGEIDGAENNPPSYHTSEHYKIAKYYTIDEHVRVPEIIVGSKIALDKLSEDDLAIMRQAAAQAQIYQQKLWEEGEQSSLEFLIEQGVEINYIEDKSAFVEAVQPVYEKYQIKYGDLIERIREE